MIEKILTSTAFCVVVFFIGVVWGAIDYEQYLIEKCGGEIVVKTNEDPKYFSQYITCKESIKGVDTDSDS